MVIITLHKQHNPVTEKFKFEIGQTVYCIRGWDNVWHVEGPAKINMVHISTYIDSKGVRSSIEYSVEFSKNGSHFDYSEWMLFTTKEEAITASKLKKPWEKK